MSRYSYKQLKELVDTTNSNLIKANIDMHINTRTFPGGYTLFANYGIETLCSGTIKECEKYLRGVNQTLRMSKFSPKILKTDSYKIEHKNPYPSPFEGDMFNSNEDDIHNLPNRGK